MSYQSISLFRLQHNNKKYELIWDLKELFSNDRIAGLLVSIKCMINRNITSDSLILRLTTSSGVITDIDLTVGPIDIIDNYIEIRGVEYSRLTSYYVPEGYYGWWIKDTSGDRNNIYNLYKFMNNDFVEGFILGFDVFDMDFRNYIAGSPFRTENKSNVFYNVDGYDIHPIVKYRREFAPVGPYYTNSYEQYERTGHEPQFVTDEAATEYPIDYS